METQDQGGDVPDPKVGGSVPNIAVIAIHGVGAHLSGASAEAVATLLTSVGRDMPMEDGGPPLYSPFVANSIGIPLRPVQAPRKAAQEANYRKDGRWLARVWGVFDERRGYLAKARKDPRFEPSGYNKSELRANEPDRGEFGYQFMLTQVAGYKGEPDRAFQTLRLEGQREVNSEKSNVHIYDAHYSDLTKPQSNILSFFLAFYQLLFHLASLSLLAVYWAEAESAKENPKNAKGEPEKLWRWRIKSSINATSVRLLTMFVPCLNLILLAIACAAFVDKAQGWAGHSVIAYGFAAFLSLGATFAITRTAASPPRPFLWAMIPFVGSAVGTVILSGLACLYHRLLHVNFPLWETLLLLTWLVAAGLILAWIASMFEPVRPGAFWLTIVLYSVNTLFFLGYLLPQAFEIDEGGRSQVATASLWAVQWIFGELSLSWILCLFLALISWPLGSLCIHGIEKTDRARRSRALAAFRTGRFVFAVPAVLFMIVTCALWAGVVVYGSDKLKAFEDVSLGAAQSGLSAKAVPSMVIPPVDSVLTWINAANAKEKSQSMWSNYLRGLLLVSVTPGLPITMATLVLSLLLLIWAVLPSVVYEIKPECAKNAAANRIRWLGNWLSRGLDNTAIITRVLWFGIVPVPLFFFAIDWLALRCRVPSAWIARLYEASKFTLPLIEQAGLLIAVSGVALFGLILKYLTSVLDTLLDVDNYLRTSPLDQTPRARIAERCVSLLRYIAGYRDGLGRPYSRVIIVAHSLGSMVTTDLLRYLQRSAKNSPDPELARYEFYDGTLPPGQEKLPICVFSMGCPLRQLLNRFFPHLYWWVSDIPDNSLADLGSAIDYGFPPIHQATLPLAEELNVRRWVNAYRSGDYIGRWLWIGQWYERNRPEIRSHAADIASVGPRREELCIGLGAHTHYWDRTAPDIAAVLDEMIK